MLTDDHAPVDFNAGADEEHAARLQCVEGIAGGLTLFHCHKYAVFPSRNVAAVWGVFIESVGHDSGAAGIRKQLSSEADQAACRNDEFQADGFPHRVHCHHLPLARPHLFDDRSLVFGGDIDYQVFHRLQFFSVFFPIDDLRLRNGHFETFTAHVLDENRQVQLSPAGYFEGVGISRILDPQGDVRAQLFFQPFADVAGGDQFPLSSGKWGVVDDEVHGNGGFVDRYVRQSFRRIGSRQRFADADAFEAGDGHDIAGACLGDFSLLQAFVAEQFRNPPFDDAAVPLHMRNGFSGSDFAVENPAGGDPADIVVVIDIGHQQLERGIGVPRRWPDVAFDHREQRFHAARLHVQVEFCVSNLGARVDDGEVELLISSVQFAEQIEHHVHHFIGAGARAVYLVDDDDRLQRQVQ